MNDSLNRAMERLKCWLGFHKKQHVLNLIVTDEGEYAKDTCCRCGKILMRYVAA